MKLSNSTPLGQAIAAAQSDEDGAGYTLLIGLVGQRDLEVAVYANNEEYFFHEVGSNDGMRVFINEKSVVYVTVLRG